MLCLPLLVLTVFAGGYAVEHALEARHATDLERFAELASAISNFLHESERERGRTGIFLASGGKKSRADLVAQRHATDSVAGQLDQALARVRLDRAGTDFRVSLDTVWSRFYLQLGVHRARVDSLQLDVSTGAGFYTSMNEAILQTVTRLSELGQDRELTRLFGAYNNFLHARERAGLERVVLSAAFTRGRFATSDEFSLFLAAVKQQETYLQLFLSASSANERSRYDSTVQGAAVNQVLWLRRQAVATGGRRPLTGATGSEWFDTATRRIGLLKSVPDRLTAELDDHAIRMQQQSRRQLLLSVAATIGLIASALTLAFPLARDLTPGVTRTVAVLEAVGAGDLSQELPVVGGDEIARMGIALNHAIAAQRRALIDVQTQVGRAEAAAAAARVAGEQAQQARDQQQRTAQEAADRERARIAQESRLADERRRVGQEQIEAARRRDQEQAERERAVARQLRATSTASSRWSMPRPRGI